MIKVEPGYPFVRDASGKFATSSDEAETIEQNITQAIGIGIGHRPMLRGKGSEVRRLIFLGEGDARDTLALDYCQEAVADNEPRAYVYRVTVQDNEDTEKDELFLKVEYGIIRTEELLSLTVTI